MQKHAGFDTGDGFKSRRPDHLAVASLSPLHQNKPAADELAVQPFGVASMRQPHGFAVELDAPAFEGLDELAQPMQKVIESAQDCVF